MKKIVGALLAALMLMGLMGGVATAQDEELMQDFVNLEKAYIPPLFFTNQGPDYIDPAQKTMNNFMTKWSGFYNKYYNYKPDYANWQSYFDAMDLAVKDAATKIGVGNEAHEALEAVRATMLELRPKNGFPKFITDKMTIYHDPMEHIVLTLKFATAPTPELMAELAITLEEAQKAWSNVEKCPVDAGLWGFTVQEMNMYYNMLQTERTALDNFAAALAAGDFALMKRTGTLALKGPFVQVYKFFGNFPSMP